MILIIGSIEKRVHGKVKNVTINYKNGKTKFVTGNPGIIYLNPESIEDVVVEIEQ